ncbi:MAG TPA: SDR family oxidoreductase [Casimicrobiaceae bacterium]|jgi:NAD(P)-dependent dehydrogenase (short-subunit alcohol dehydrogenase family)|nr:SDR family oxidoreductase [Casimicrobiaceae bacterium]
MATPNAAASALASYPSLAGKTAFVSGGGSGIGAVIVAHLAQQGCNVAFCDVAKAPSEALVSLLAPAPVRFYHCDVRDIAALRATLAVAANELGAITILVNNAARDDRHDLSEVTPEYWDDRQAVNLRHHFFAAQSVVPAMAKHGGGAIINMGSVSWMRGTPGMIAYTTAKAAISGLTRSLARELGMHNIRVNSVVPGAILTERQIKLWLTPDLEREFIDGQCLKFRLTESDVARATLFLASDEARAITGHNLIVDGGLAQTRAG